MWNANGSFTKNNIENFDTSSLSDKWLSAYKKDEDKDDIFKKERILNIEPNWVDLTDYEKNSLNLIDNFMVVNPGIIYFYASKNIPKGWLECDGSILEKDKYKRLYDAIGDMYSDGLTEIGKFKLPDLRGYFVRNFDNRNSIVLDNKTDLIDNWDDLKTRFNDPNNHFEKNRLKRMIQINSIDNILLDNWSRNSEGKFLIENSITVDGKKFLLKGNQNNKIDIDRNSNWKDKNSRIKQDDDNKEHNHNASVDNETDDYTPTGIFNAFFNTYRHAHNISKNGSITSGDGGSHNHGCSRYDGFRRTRWHHSENASSYKRSAWRKFGNWHDYFGKGSHTHHINYTGSHKHTINDFYFPESTTGESGRHTPTLNSRSSSITANTLTPHNHVVNIDNTGTENVPKNFALKACIKY